MCESNRSYLKIINDFDNKSESIQETQIGSDLSRYSESLKRENKEIPDQLKFEIISFDLIENYFNETTGWGTYYGPQWVGSTQSGEINEYPSITMISNETLEYWSTRAKEAKHPVLKARYADLVWDFSPSIINKKADPNMAQIVIDANIEIAEKKLHASETDIIFKLERALSLALRLNDKNRIKRVTQSILDYEDSIAEDKKLGLWGFSYELLLEKNKIVLTKDQENKIISDLEERLNRVSDLELKDNIDPFAAEQAALYLAKYYQKYNKNEDKEKVLIKYGNTFVKMSEGVSALIASSWLQKVYSIYYNFGIKSEADKIAIELSEINKKTNDELKTISHSVKKPEKDLNNYISAMIEGDIEEVLHRIASNFIPQKNDAENQGQKLSIKNATRYLVQSVILDERGHSVAVVGPLREDIEGHVIRQITQNMAISDYFLELSLDNFHKKFSPSIETILDYLYKSPVFKVNKKSVFKSGLEAYLKKDFVMASHILIPHIEDSFRYILELSRKSVYKPGRHGGLFLKILDEILRDEIFSQIFGEDAVLYFKILFIDQRGYNLRNNICHGIISPQDITYEIANRIFHTLLVLGQVHYENKNPNDKNE